MKANVVEIRVNQIWIDDDPRFDTRCVLVTYLYKDVATIITCDKHGTPLPGKRHSNAKRSRFGKSRGYKLFKDAR